MTANFVPLRIYSCNGTEAQAPQVAADRLCRITAFSILLFTETMQPSGFFLKKKPPSMLS
jgi:hypothetical protein